MTELEYKFVNDTLFKMVFVEYPELLKRFVSRILNIRFEDIEEFTITNSEMPPEELAGKMCRLDINMIVNGRLVDLEVQVQDEKDYPERSLFHWAREFSSSLSSGKNYADLPETIIISILAFKQFDCDEFHSEFRPLEVTRGTRLTNKMCLYYFELPKIPSKFDETDELNWWLTLFKAKTVEEILEIETKGGPVMAKAVEAYRHVTADEKFRQLERMRFDAQHHEQAAVTYAEQRATHNAKLEVARKLRAKGMSVDEVAEMTGLTVDDVLRL